MENKNFAVFIMVYGRPEKNLTYQTLRKCGYTGKIYLVGDNTDSSIDNYKKKYGADLIIFDKKEVSKKFDSGDNSGDLRSTMYAANTIFDLAIQKNIEYFYIMCDDYYEFDYMFKDEIKGMKLCHNIEKIFDLTINFYKTTNALTIAFAQTGDFIGGIDNGKGVYRFSKRKVMNSFLCSTKRRFNFLGRMNEDVTTYVNLGSKGELFLTIPVIAINQKDTQQISKGLTELYLDNGTYIKSMFSVIYNPSCVKVSMMNADHKRIHHSISWINAVPMIISEKWRKNINIEDTLINKYSIGDIVTFTTTDENLNGIIKGLQNNTTYHIKGLNGKTYFKKDNEITELIGKSRINKARANAEEWEKLHGDYIKYEDKK